MSAADASARSPMKRIVARAARWRDHGVRRTPTILQMEAVECGAASLAMVLAFHGVWVPLEQLRVACGVSRDGSKASNIVKAASAFGLVVRGFKKEPAQLSDLPMPCIVHWNFNHFLVLEGLDETTAYLNDPAQGRRLVSLDEFDESFTGVVLTFELGVGFRKTGRSPSTLAVMSRLLRGSRGAVWLLLLVSGMLVVPGILVATFTRVFVDDILLRGSEDWLRPLLIGMAATALTRGLITALQQSLLLRLQTKISVAMASRFLWHVMALPIAFFHQRHAGDIAARVGANERIARLVSGAPATNALNLISLILFAAAMTLYDGLLTAIGIGLSLLNVVALAMGARRREELNNTLAIERGKLDGAAIAIIRTIETLKAGGLEDDAFARWAGHQALVLNAERRLGVYAAFTEVFPPFFAAATTAVILGLGGVQVMHGDLTVGGLIAFQSLMASFSAPVTSLVQSASGFLAIKGDLARLEDVFNYPAEPRVPPRPGPVRKLSGRIEITDLAFAYSPLDPPVVSGFQLSLRPGMRVALVGASGSGKSTIGRLIAGLASPGAGSIRFDGTPRDQIPSALFAASVAYVDQEAFLFEGAARDNVTLWDPEADDAAIVGALKDAAIYDDLVVRPGGLMSYVREGGDNFSGGQRQRIELARALVGDPSVLILDEATAALDPATEKQIDDNLRRRGCTCIIVAHRLSTIRDCDEILVLDQGKVVERGVHDDLMALDGVYARLAELA